MNSMQEERGVLQLELQGLDHISKGDFVSGRFGAVHGAESAHTILPSFL